MYSVARPEFFLTDGATKRLDVSSEQRLSGFSLRWFEWVCFTYSCSPSSNTAFWLKLSIVSARELLSATSRCCMSRQYNPRSRCAEGRVSPGCACGLISKNNGVFTTARSPCVHRKLEFGISLRCTQGDRAVVKTPAFFKIRLQAQPGDAARSAQRERGLYCLLMRHPLVADSSSRALTMDSFNNKAVLVDGEQQEWLNFTNSNQRRLDSDKPCSKNTSLRALGGAVRKSAGKATEYIGVKWPA
jgi:hypothetical protein